MRRLKWLQELINLIYPNLCVACQDELVEGETQLCTHCRWDLPITGYHLQKENYVTRLFSGRIPINNGSAFLYFRRGRDNYRSMIHRMKYYSRRDIAQMMGEIMGLELSCSDLYQDIDLLIPIPLHWSRKMNRGYNQAEELCRGLSKSMTIPVDSRSVKRSKKTKQQARHKGHKRWENVAEAFSIRHKYIENLKGKHLLIVDDVLTSGATIESCARAIINAVPDVKISVVTLAVAERKTNYYHASFQPTDWADPIMNLENHNDQKFDQDIDGEDQFNSRTA